MESAQDDGNRSRPGQAHGRLGGATGSHGVVAVSRQRGFQCIAPREIPDFDVLDGVVLLTLCHGRQGEDVGLLQWHLAQHFAQLSQGGFQLVHPVSQGGYRSKGVHRSGCPVSPSSTHRLSQEGEKSCIGVQVYSA